MISVVKRDAEGAILTVGCLILLAGVVSQVGPWGLQSVVPPVASIALGLALIATGMVWVAFERRRVAGLMPRTVSGTLPEVATDAEFLLKAFVQGMPPAFVKEVTDTESSKHVLQSDALAQLQSLNDRIPLRLDLAYVDERRRMIKADHRRADEQAMNAGRSRQIELLDALEGDPLRTVLTTKTRVDHHGRTYIVGWGIPVYLTNRPASNTIQLRHDSNTVQFNLAPGPGIETRVGEAVLQLLPPSESPQSGDREDGE